MSAVTDSAVARLESVLGANAIFVAKAANRELYALDGVSPTAFAKPASTEQAAEIVRFAAKENLSVIPIGARTKPLLHSANSGSSYDVALDLTALDDVAPTTIRLTLIVSVGALHAASQSRTMLREQNQFALAARAKSLL